MRKNILKVIVLVCLSTILVNSSFSQQFVTVQGKDFIGPDGQQIILKGTNLGNWLVPEGYMFKFKNTNSPRLIDQALRELIGPEITDQFWRQYLDNYIRREDIRFLKNLGINHVRVPFNYRLFTGMNYMGQRSEGFKYLDRVVNWCKAEGLWVLLDMHCAPGGQTGDNIDDSFGYPFLYENESYKQEVTDIWQSIANHYKDDPTVIGYDLLNEPISSDFPNKDQLNKELEPLYKRIVGAIRLVDENHLVFLGGAQWDNNFKVFGKPFDDKAVYTFHKYWFEVKQQAIQEYIDFSNQWNVPIYMGESGENTDEWVASFRKLLDVNGLSWCFWPYKKMENSRGIMNFEKPVDYDLIIEFVNGDRSSFKKIRESRPDQSKAKTALDGFLENCLFENCFTNEGYVKALGLTLP